jgi:hypothetical protein
MSSTDLVVAPDHLRRVRVLYPNAVGIGRVRGYRHQATGERQRMAKRGEVAPQWRFARRNERTGIVTIPYVRLKELAQVRREVAIRVGAMVFGAAVFLAGVAYALWTIRMLLLTAAGTVLGLTVLLWFLSHWRNGCPGLHCNGCHG